MRRVLTAAFGMIFVVGCTLPQRYTVDVAKVEGCESFDWTGRVTVRKTYKGFFAGYTVDLVKLEARDGRAVLLDTTGKGVEAYVKVEVDTCRQDTERPAEVRQMQNSPNQ